MSKSLLGLSVLIASPGDTRNERAEVIERIWKWNRENAFKRGFFLQTWAWEHDAIPKTGDRPQGIINAQAVDQADIVVAFFSARLGTPTGEEISGTVEETKRATDAGKPVHIYFSDSVDRAADREQFDLLETYRTELEQEGLYGSYSGAGDLADKVIQALEHDLDDVPEWRSATATALTQMNRSADLKWHHDREREPKGLDSKGKMQYRSLANDLVVRNDGTLAATGMTFTVEPVDGTRFHMDDASGEQREPFTVEPGSEMSWGIGLSPRGMGDRTGGTVKVAAQWLEDERPMSQAWTVRLQR